MLAAGVDVLLRIDSTPGEIDAVRSALDDSPGVKSFRFVDQEETYREWERIYRIAPNILADIRPQDLNDAFRVDLEGGATAQRSFIQQLTARALTGVDFISSAFDYCLAQGCVPRGRFAIVAFRPPRNVRSAGSSEALEQLLRRDPAVRWGESIDPSFCLTPSKDNPERPNVIIVAPLRAKADGDAFVRRARGLPTVRAVEVRHE
jgi:hypothetical protein